MKRREFLQFFGLSGAVVLLARLGWSIQITGVPAGVADNSNKPLITFPFGIAAKGETASPPLYKILLPGVLK